MDSFPPAAGPGSGPDPTEEELEELDAQRAAFGRHLAADASLLHALMLLALRQDSDLSTLLPHLRTTAQQQNGGGAAAGAPAGAAEAPAAVELRVEPAGSPARRHFSLLTSLDQRLGRAPSHTDDARRRGGVVSIMGARKGGRHGNDGWMGSGASCSDLNPQLSVLLDDVDDARDAAIAPIREKPKHAPQQQWRQQQQQQQQQQQSRQRPPARGPPPLRPRHYQPTKSLIALEPALRCDSVYRSLQQQVTDRQLEGGLAAPAPMLAGVYAQAESMYAAFHKCLSISSIPFPFPVRFWLAGEQGCMMGQKGCRTV